MHIYFLFWFIFHIQGVSNSPETFEQKILITSILFRGLKFFFSAIVSILGGIQYVFYVEISNYHKSFMLILNAIHILILTIHDLTP